MSEETLKVLKMVSEGKISPEDGEKLLSAMDTKAPVAKNKRNSMLRIRVEVNDPEKKEQVRVNANVPLLLAKKAAGLVSLLPKEAKKEMQDVGVDLDAIDLRELIALFEEGEITEELVNVDVGTETEGAKVRVYVD